MKTAELGRVRLRMARRVERHTARPQLVAMLKEARRDVATLLAEVERMRAEARWECVVPVGSYDCRDEKGVPCARCQAVEE